MIKKSNILGVFDIDKLTVYKVNRNYLSKSEKRGKIINVTHKIPKSFVVCKESFENVVYISPLNTATLYKRLIQNDFNFCGGD